jgi:uncharacterized protein YfaQ (DUF2300 family)
MSNLIDLNQGALSHFGLGVSHPGGEAMKQNYRVSFFKQLVDSTGHPFDVCQGVVEVHAISRKAAVDDAKRIFAELKDVKDWSLRADHEGVELLPGRQTEIKTRPVWEGHKASASD